LGEFCIKVDIFDGSIRAPCGQKPVKVHGKKGFVTATKLGTTDKIFVAATKNFATATKRFVDRTKHFVVVAKFFCSISLF